MNIGTSCPQCHEPGPRVPLDALIDAHGNSDRFEAAARAEIVRTYRLHGWRIEDDASRVLCPRCGGLQ